ncbi:class II aldolase/adducin family protein [Pseudomonas sp. LP_7_YM]|uniref:class II aldolase/adducin family protein n=1 Tax=Pseudomonas sp. LP_7_YM TaxID=2485137 RepID=UPI0010620D12|nr:class II aldolase/adducin family protein [Pseudomonas sp. LP_7_YM]TDV59711.1 ribulose-5-phosphate 4-epimerase/fuculose-1-phosphate aldolase [Pseudomonas sp. LP_7_YM]
MSELPPGMCPKEWAARCELAALYRLIAHLRMTDLIDTHISLRLEGPEGHFLINRYGTLFERMKASTLVKIDGEGNVVDEHYPDHRVNRAGFVIHSAIHLARPDLHCVIHTHTAAGIAVSAQASGLLPLSQHALKFYNRLAYHGYEGIATRTAEREQLVKDLGPRHKAMILRNHGLLAAGASAADAFMTIYFLERACQAQVQAMAAGVELVQPDPETCEFTARQFEADDDEGIVALAWEAALEMIVSQRQEYCS